MEQTKLVKKIDPCECPHCKKEIFISFQTSIPGITEISTKESIEKVKKEIKEQLEQIEFKDEKEKEHIITWLDNTLLDSSDVDPVIKQVAEEQLKKIQNEKENENEK